MEPIGRDTSPYGGLVNLLELIMPPVLDYYLENVVNMPCQCGQCRRDVMALTLASLPSMYYGSIWAHDLEDLQIAWRSLSMDAIDQSIRRAAALIGESNHHTRKGVVAPPGVEKATPQELADKIIAKLLERPLLERLYGVPVPMCIACNEVARRPVSQFCDRCGAQLVPGLPATNLRN